MSENIFLGPCMGIRLLLLPALFTLASSQVFCQEDDTELEKIEVTGSRIQKKNADEVSKIEISTEEAELVAPGGDVAQVPKLFPGTLARPQDSEVSIRGSDRQEALYYVDDLQFPELFEPISGTSIVPTRAISTLSFYPGNFDAQYGNSTAGVIKLDTRGGDITTPYSEFRVNIPIYLSAYHEQELGEDSTTILSFRKSTLEAITPYFVQEDGQVLLPYFQDAYLQHYIAGDKFSVKTRLVHSLSGAEVKVFTNRSTSTDGTSEFNFERSFNLLGADMEFGWMDLNIEVDPYVVARKSNFSFNEVFFEIESNSLTIPLRNQIQVNNDFNIFIGYELEYVDFSLDALVPDRVGQSEFNDPENSNKISLDVSDTLYSQAIWSSFEYALGGLLISPGLRLYTQSNNKKDGFDPRLGLRYKIDPINTIKGGVGQYTSSPNPEELTEDYGNPDLLWIRSLHYSLGWETIIANRWISDLQLFYKGWRDDVTDDLEQRYLSSTTRTARGLEWFLRYSDLGNWFGWLSYTLSEVKEQRGPEAKEVDGENNSTHVLHMVGNYKLSDSFQLGGRFKYQTGYVYTPIEDVWYQANTDTYQPEENQDLINSKRVPELISASVFLQKDWKYTNWDLVTRFGLEEYQFKKSSPNIAYNYDYSQMEYTVGLKVIPYIELRAIF